MSDSFFFKQTTGVNGMQPPKVTFPTTPDAIQPVSEQPTQLHVREPKPERPETVQGYFLRLVEEFRRAKTAVLLSFAVGAAIGLIWLGWYVFPVQWTGGTYTHLTERDKVNLVLTLADLNAYDPETGRVMMIGRNWYEMSDYACALARQEADPAQQARLVSLAWRLNGYGCQ